MTIDYITFSNLIIDDIVFSDGRTAMNILGGSGTHALTGMRVWSDRLGYAGSIGDDLDPIHIKNLNAFGVNTDGLVLRDNYQTARAWQIFEPNDLRIEIFRTDPEEFDRRQVMGDDLPPHYVQAKGVHFSWGTLLEMEEVIHQLRAANPTIKLVMETTPNQLNESKDVLKRILPLLDCFAPDLDEARVISAESTTPEALCDTLLGWGAPLVAIRMGKRGSMLKASNGDGWQLPAVPTNIVDVTGAGNSYCGGLLTGLGDSVPALEAGLRAVVSASFALEQLGLPTWTTPPADEVKRRLEWARERVELL